MIDIYNNSLIANEELTAIFKKFIDDLAEGKTDEAIKMAKDIKEGLKESLTDEEYVNEESKSSYNIMEEN